MTHPQRTPVAGPEIEALARELTDEQTAAYFAAADVCGSDPRTREAVEATCGLERLGLVEPSANHRPARYYLTDRGRALLAYLDEVWAGLKIRPRESLRRLLPHTFQRPCVYPSRDNRYQGDPGGPPCYRILLRKGLLTTVFCNGAGYCPTPLGRAVLRRAKEQGRA